MRSPQHCQTSDGVTETRGDVEWRRDDRHLTSEATMTTSRATDADDEGSDNEDYDARMDSRRLPPTPANSLAASHVTSSNLLTLPGGNSFRRRSPLHDESCSSFISSVSQRRTDRYDAHDDDVTLQLPPRPQQQQQQRQQQQRLTRRKSRVYLAPGSARDDSRETIEPVVIRRSFNNSNIIRDYRGADNINDNYVQNIVKPMTKKRPMTTGALRRKRAPPKLSVFRNQRDLSDDEFERVQRISRPTIASSCREINVRIPKPDPLNIALRPPNKRMTSPRGRNVDLAGLPLIDSQRKQSRFAGVRRVDNSQMKDIVNRLYRFDPDRIPDSRRVTPLHVRRNPNIVNSHLWMGTDYSYRIHNSSSANYQAFDMSMAKLSC